ncbi:hypothetical protein N7448_011174 [Penicillium atrosanguineum]|nr:hypothetical protein N7448_011174 [Penicillium atrosanguineum]
MPQRRILDNQYIRSLHNPKMRIVKESVKLIKPKSIVTSAGEHKVDFIVSTKTLMIVGKRINWTAGRQILATGFQFTQWKAETVIGRQKKSLQQHWDHVGGISAYKTVAVNGFPNMFYLLGPNSGSGHTSVLFSMEWLVSPCIAYCEMSVGLTSQN